MRARHQRFTCPRVRVSRPGRPGGPVHGPLRLLQVREQQLGLDGLDVVERRNPSRNVSDVAGIEAAHHVRDGSRLPDAGEEPVSESFPLRCAGHEPRDVDEFHRRRHHALRPGDRRDSVEARIGDRNDADVRLDGAEGIVLRGRGCTGQRVVQRGLAHVRQPHNRALDAHVRGFSCPVPSSLRLPARRARVGRTNAAGWRGTGRWNVRAEVPALIRRRRCDRAGAACSSRPRGHR